jgi:putative transposase
MEAIAQALVLARSQPEQVSVLYADETTCYRQPFLGFCWHEQGSDGNHQPVAELAHKCNSTRRIVGTLDALTGRVLYRANSKIGVWQLCAFLKQVRKAYGPTRRVYLVWDNWPIHFYDKVLAEARLQRIELLNLPTYAPWTNPIEKLWRKLKQEVLCMHKLSNEWEQLKEAVHTFLTNYDRPAPDLLEYVGLAKVLPN